jgi:hypothetical protein
MENDESTGCGRIERLSIPSDISLRPPPGSCQNLQLKKIKAVPGRVPQ